MKSFSLLALTTSPTCVLNSTTHIPCFTQNPNRKLKIQIEYHLLGNILSIKKTLLPLAMLLSQNVFSSLYLYMVTMMDSLGGFNNDIGIFSCCGFCILRPNVHSLVGIWGNSTHNSSICRLFAWKDCKRIYLTDSLPATWSMYWKIAKTKNKNP